MKTLNAFGKGLLLLGLIIIFDGKTYGNSALSNSDIIGIVKDASTKKVIPSASILLLGTTIGTSSDLDGNFVINKVPTGVYILKVSHLGYEPKEIRVEVFGTGDIKIDFELSPETLKNEAVVITATRTPRYLYEVPIRTEVVTAEELRHHNPDNMIEAVSHIPGVQPEVSCAICNSSGISIQGMPGRYTQVLIDDMPMYSGLGAAYSFLTVPPDAIDQIEVVKGANSVLYGTDAIAGIVNLRTIRPYDYPRMSLETEIGEYGRRSLGGTTSYKKEKLGLLVSAQYFNAEPRDADGDGITEYTGTERSYVSGKALYEASDNTELNVRVTGIVEDRQGGRISENRSIIEVLDDSRYRDLSETILTRRSEVSAKLSHIIDSQWSVSYKSAYSNHVQDSDYEGFLYIADQDMLYNEIQLNHQYDLKHNFTIGAAYRYESTDENVSVSNHTYKIGSVYLQHDFDASRYFESIIGVRYDSHNIFGSVFTPTVAFKSNVSDTWTARIAYGRGFRAPATFIEMVDQGIGVQYKYNIDYRAEEGEKSQSLTLSMDYQKGTTTLNLSPFYHRIDNLIAARNDQDAQKFVVENLDATSHVYGFELGSSVSPYKNIYFDLSYIFQELDMDDGVLNYAKPPHRIRWMFDLDHPGTSLSLVVNGEINSPMDLHEYWGTQYNADGSQKISESPWFQMINAELAWELMQGVRMAVGGKNLTDYTIMDEDGPLQYAFDSASSSWQLDDTKYIWGPMQGRVMYVRLSLSLD